MSSCSWVSFYNKLPACCQSDCCRPNPVYPIVTDVTPMTPRPNHVSLSFAKESVPSISSQPPNAQAPVRIFDFTPIRQTDSVMPGAALNRKRVDELAKKVPICYGQAVITLHTPSQRLSSPIHRVQASTDIVSLDKMLKEGPNTQSMEKAKENE